MSKITLNQVTNYLMFLTLSLFTAICLYFFSVMLISRLQGDNPSPMIPWTTLHVGFVLLIIPMIGKKIFNKVVEAKEDVELPRGAGVFVGLIRGLLYGGALLVVGGAAMFCLAPEKLLQGEVSSVAWGVLIVTGCAGVFFPPQMVARRTRLWLLLTVVCQFVMLSTMRQLLGLYPLKFEYDMESADLSRMPLLDKNSASKILPPGAENVEISGVRGSDGEVRLHCRVQAKDLETFIQMNKYTFPENRGTEFTFGDNKCAVFVYNSETSLLQGFYRVSGLPEKLLRK